MKSLKRALLALGLGGAGVYLVHALMILPEAPSALTDAVTARMDQSGVTHPLTAVLMNFRGYDTLLEIGVLLLAALAALAVLGAVDTLPKPVLRDRPEVLQSLIRWLGAPLLVTVFYLLWIGSYRPGGAFQAGSVLGAGGVLLTLSGLLVGLRWHAAWRWLLGAGFLTFLLVSVLVMPGSGALLAYPREGAGLLILLIEFAATLSIGAILTLLFLAVMAGGEESP